MSANIDPIVQALHVLLVAAAPHAVAKAETSSRTAATRLRLLAKTSDSSEADDRVGALLTDPIGSAFRKAMRDLGEHLFAADGTTTLMRYASERLYDLAPAEIAVRATLLDEAWHGIGQGRDRWVSY